MDSNAAIFESLVDLLVRNYVTNGQRHVGPNDEPDRSSSPSIVLVLGAGASAYAQLPNWNIRLRDRLIDHLTDRFQDPDLFADICDQLRIHGVALPPLKLDDGKQGDPGTDSDLSAVTIRARREAEQRARHLKNQDDLTIEVLCGTLFRHGFLGRTLRHFMADQFASSRWPLAGPPPILAYELIAHLLKHGFIDHIITFNFDELLDTALANEMGPDGFVKVFSDHAPTRILALDRPKLIKLHGTASSPETMRFTFKDTSLLSRGMQDRLEAMLTSMDRPPHFISLGYSWRDRGLIHWIRRHVERIHGLTVVKRFAKVPQLLDHGAIPDLALEILAAEELRQEPEANRCIDLGDLVWALTERALRRLRADVEPVQPIGRHAILGKLFADQVHPPLDAEAIDVDAAALKRRVIAEVLLQLAKGKGLLNTSSAPYSPRVAAYFKMLRDASSSRADDRRAEGVTIQGFLGGLGVGGVMERSEDPEARDTFFAVRQDLSASLSRYLAASHLAPGDASSDRATQTVRCPEWTGGAIRWVTVSREQFAVEQLDKIIDSSDIEISATPDARVAWIFSRPREIGTFSQFCYQVAWLVERPWTHLLAVVESSRWLELPWVRHALAQQCRDGCKVLELLPGEEGLRQWRSKDRFLYHEPELPEGCVRLHARMPWWRHNRHMLLALESESGRLRTHGGLYFAREFRSSVVSATYLDLPRDHVKQLHHFLLYARRSLDGTSPGPRDAAFYGELRILVDRLGADHEMLSGQEDSDDLVAGAEQLLEKLVRHRAFPGGG